MSIQNSMLGRVFHCNFGCTANGRRFGMKNAKETKNFERAQELFAELLGILESQKEMNWIRGVKAAIRELNDGEGGDSVDGFENAKSIYNMMASGGRGFAEYSIWNADEHERINLSRRLDEIRGKLWSEFKL